MNKICYLLIFAFYIKSEMVYELGIEEGLNTKQTGSDATTDDKLIFSLIFFCKIFLLVALNNWKWIKYGLE